MSKNRQAAQSIILNDIQTIDPSGLNGKRYKELFDEMSDQQFDDFMKSLKDKSITLRIITPNFPGSKRITRENNLAFLKKNGVSIAKKIIIEPTDAEKSAGVPIFTSKIPRITYMIGTRRQSQILEKKIKTPIHANKIDISSGSVINESSGATLTFPEVLGLKAQGLDFTITELMKTRGGDNTAYSIMNNNIHNTGHVKLEDTNKENSRARSSETLSAMLKAAHLNNNI